MSSEAQARDPLGCCVGRSRVEREQPRNSSREQDTVVRWRSVPRSSAARCPATGRSRCGLHKGCATVRAPCLVGSTTYLRSAFRVEMRLSRRRSPGALPETDDSSTLALLLVAVVGQVGIECRTSGERMGGQMGAPARLCRRHPKRRLNNALWCVPHQHVAAAGPGFDGRVCGELVGVV
jgi:hypothetical protein